MTHRVFVLKLLWRRFVFYILTYWRIFSRAFALCHSFEISLQFPSEAFLDVFVKGRCGGSGIRACIVPLTPVLSVFCVLLSWSFSQSRTAQYQHCHQMQLWHWPVWWMELFTYFLRFRQTKDTLLSYFCSHTGNTCFQSFVEISWFLKRLKLKGCWN